MNSNVGIDVAKAKLDVCLLRSGQRAAQATFDNSVQGLNKLHRWLQRRRAVGSHVCLEATGRYGEAASTFLHAAGYAVSVVNPARIKAYGRSQLQRNKTDKLDAALIADFCRTQQPPLWNPPDPAWRELNALVRHYDNLLATRQQQVNRLKAGVSSAAVTAHLQAQIELFEQQMATVRQQIDSLLNAHPHLKRQRDLLVSIPGIGDLTAGKLLAELRFINTCNNVRQLVAFAGLNPKQRQSGSSVRGRTPISKMGPASLRAALYMPALVAMQHNPILVIFSQRLRERGLKGKALVVAVMRKLLHLVYGILKSGQPFDPHYLEKSASAA